MGVWLGSDHSQLAATGRVGYKTRPPWLKQSNREGLNVAAKSKTSATSSKSSAKTASPVKRKTSVAVSKATKAKPAKSPVKAVAKAAAKAKPAARKTSPAKSPVVKSKPAAKPVARVVVKAKVSKPAAKPASKVAVGKAGKSASKPNKQAVKAIAKPAPKSVATKASSKTPVKAIAKTVKKPVSKQPVAKTVAKASKPGKVVKSAAVSPRTSTPSRGASSVLSMVKSATRAIAKVVGSAGRGKADSAPKVAAKPASTSRAAKPATSSSVSTKDKKLSQPAAVATRKAVESAPPIAAQRPSKITATVSKASPPAAKAPLPSSGIPNETGNSMKSSGTRSTPPGKTSAAATGGRAVGVKSAKPVAVQAPLTAVKVVRVDLPEGYRPARGEEYMNPLHLEYFRQKLINWRAELVEESKQTIDNLREEVRDVGDEAERATRETENSLELRTRDRYRKLINKIEKAIKRIDEGEYGYCEETGEEIGLERLEARPIATLCLDAQERYEHRQKMMGD